MIKTYSKVRGNLVLVNGDYGYKENTPMYSLVTVGKPGIGVPLNFEAAVMLDRLMSEIDGWQNIVPISGWRSIKEQQSIWENSVLENGEAFTRKYVALPGHSEHHTGLAIDIGIKKENIDFICPDFPSDGIGAKFREIASNYGFIERYKKGKEHITGISAEPWHFRYVGLPHAKIITDYKICLEEYHQLLKSYKGPENPLKYRMGTKTYKIYHANNDIAQIKIDSCTDISGNSKQGYIITEQKDLRSENGTAGKYSRVFKRK